MVKVRKNLAFTLAEVLITLGIIGVVAALTIPTLIQKADERATVTALKKSYSVVSNAYNLAVQENGTLDTWGMVVNDPEILNKLKPYLNVTKDCIAGEQGCFPTGVAYLYIKAAGNNGIYDNSTNSKLRLADGTLLKGQVPSATYAQCKIVAGTSTALNNVCGIYDIDINGDKPPNQIGKDLFRFWVTKYGIIPAGSAQETTFTFANNCDNSGAVGWGCTAWALIKENMEYAHCSGVLSWGGNDKCN